jgi:hypothetical protein
VTAGRFEPTGETITAAGRCEPIGKFITAAGRFGPTGKFVTAAGRCEPTGGFVTASRFWRTGEFRVFTESGAVVIFVLGPVGRPDPSCVFDETGAVFELLFGRRGSQGRAGRGSMAPSKLADSILMIWAPLSFRTM